jgi:hypothetical protein
MNRILTHKQMKTFFYLNNITRNFKRALKAGMLLIAMAFTTNSFATTLLIDPAGDGGFSNGSTFNENGWTVSNFGSSVNQWVCGTAISTSPFAGRSAYISLDGGATNTYNTGASTSVYFYRDVTIPAGENVLTLTFNWNGNGESNWDMIQIWTAPTTVVPTGEGHPGSGLNGPTPPSLTGAISTQLNRRYLARFFSIIDYNSNCNFSFLRNSGHYYSFNLLLEK